MSLRLFDRKENTYCTVNKPLKKNAGRCKFPVVVLPQVDSISRQAVPPCAPERRQPFYLQIPAEKIHFGCKKGVFTPKRVTKNRLGVNLGFLHPKRSWIAVKWGQGRRPDEKQEPLGAPVCVWMTGLEPATSWSLTRCATNCATSRRMDRKGTTFSENNKRKCKKLSISVFFGFFFLSLPR